ncbi:MAG: nickel insertion protein [Actinomycetota bacterium]
MNTIDCVQFEANVDDMDPRLWPRVLDRLLAAGSHDAWITPILMKKGRPAMQLGVLCSLDDADDIRDLIFSETTTIGLREFAVRKHVLDRAEASVDVAGERIATKTAFDGAGVVQNRSVEWDDVAAAADALGLSAKEVLASAIAAASADAERSDERGS